MASSILVPRQSYCSGVSLSVENTSSCKERKVQLSEFCDNCSEENISSTVQHVLLLNLFPELLIFCKYLN